MIQVLELFYATLNNCWDFGQKKKICIQIGSNETVQPLRQPQFSYSKPHGGRVVECQPVLSAKQGLSNLAFTPPQRAPVNNSAQLDSLTGGPCVQAPGSIKALLRAMK